MKYCKELLQILGAIGAGALIYSLGCAANKAITDYDIGLGEEISAIRIDSNCYIKCRNPTIKDYKGDVFKCNDLTFIVNGSEVKSFEEFACPEKLSVKVKKSR